MSDLSELELRSVDDNNSVELRSDDDCSCGERRGEVAVLPSRAVAVGEASSTSMATPFLFVIVTQHDGWPDTDTCCLLYTSPSPRD